MTASSASVASVPRPLATPPEVAEFLGVPLKTIYEWRYKGEGPRVRRIGRHLRFDWRDVEKWVASR